MKGKIEAFWEKHKVKIVTGALLLMALKIAFALQHHQTTKATIDILVVIIVWLEYDVQRLKKQIQGLWMDMLRQGFLSPEDNSGAARS